MSARLPKHVWVYGGDHSPWVQAVLLGLHEKGIAHTLVSAPPPAVFAHSGILMPAAKIDEGPWLLDSARILGELGFTADVPEAERRALGRIFLGGARERTAKPWTFWHRFSLARDGHPSLGRRLLHHLVRPFSVFTFFTLITGLRRRVPPRSREQLRDDFAFFEERLAEGGPLLGGDEPDTVDLQLFGLVQMCASIPGPALAVLREDPALPSLRAWISDLQVRFSAYGHLYSGPYFEPDLPTVATTSPLERAAYWLGAAVVWLLFPLSLALSVFVTWRVRAKGLQRG